MTLKAFITAGIVTIAISVFAGSGNYVNAGFVRAPHKTSQQQGTLEFPPYNPSATTAPGSSLPPGPSGPIAPNPLVTGGPAGPNDPFYCIDDEDPEGCDDNTAFHVPKGSGGPGGTCGTIMDAAHKLVSSLPQGLKDFRDSLNPAISNTCHNSGSYSGGYISTFFVIDAYNLAGLNELSKSNANHVTGAGMMNWWQAMQVGYKFIPFTPAVMRGYAAGTQNLNGCVMFIQMPSGGVHVGIVNAFEVVNQAGDGVLSILQSGARYFIDRFPVVGWDVKNTTPPLHQTSITGVVGFGCHQ